MGRAYVAIRQLSPSLASPLFLPWKPPSLAPFLPMISPVRSSSAQPPATLSSFSLSLAQSLFLPLLSCLSLSSATFDLRTLTIGRWHLWLHEAQTALATLDQAWRPLKLRQRRVGAWESGHGSSIDPPSLATFDYGSWLHEVPFDPTIVMVSLVHDESGQNSKHAFRDGLSKLWQLICAKQGLISR